MFVDCGNKMVNLDKYAGISICVTDVFSEDKTTTVEYFGQKYEEPDIVKAWYIQADGIGDSSSKLTELIQNKEMVEALFDSMKNAYKNDEIWFDVNKRLAALEKTYAPKMDVVFGNKSNSEQALHPILDVKEDVERYA